MKKIFTFIFLIFCFSSFGRGWYFSNVGNDLIGNGTVGNTYATIAKLNTFFSSLAAGDSVLFKCGDTFSGALIVSKSGSVGNPIVIGAYGTGAKPIFTGLSTVTGWASLGGNIWEATVSGVKNNVNLVLKDGNIQQVGRYPNTNAANGGYLTITSGTLGSIGGTSTLVGPALSSVTDWTNAELVIKIKAWDIQRQKVNSHSSGTLSYTEQFGEYAPASGFGYFFQRDPRTLDQDGEWYYDTSASKLRMYFSDNIPASHVVNISTIDTLIYATNRNYITIRDIEFIGANKVAVYHQFGVGIKVVNCDIKKMGADGVYGYYSESTSIDSCSSRNALASAFFLVNQNANPVQSILNCSTDSTAMIPGMDRSGDGYPRSGITVIGDSSSIMNNRVVNCGYIGIEGQGNRFYVKYNYVDSFGIKKNDVGGIYMYEGFTNPKIALRSRRFIIKNVVLNGLYTPYGVPSISYSNGLYLDGGTRNVICDSNTVAYMSGAGFHANSPDTVSLSNNIIYNCRETVSITRWPGTILSRGLTIKNNIFYPYKFFYQNFSIDNPSITRDADVAALGVIDSNYYTPATGLDTSFYGATMLADGTGYTGFFLTFPYIKNTIGIEPSSRSLSSGGILRYNTTNSIINTDLGTSHAYADAKGVTYLGVVAVAPYSSLMLNILPWGIIRKGGRKLTIVH